jgi:uncharacterized protein YkwD
MATSESMPMKTSLVRWVGCVGLAVLAAGCTESRVRRPMQPGAYGYGGYGYQNGGYTAGNTGGYGYAAPNQGGLPVLNQGGRPVALGSAFTAFGPLLSQLPQMQFPLPPLPTSQGGNGGFPFPFPTTGNFPFPFPTPSPGPGPVPTPQPPIASDDWPAQWQAFEDEVLLRTNQTRARGVVCGGQAMPPAGPVGPNAALRRSARGHSKDMADRNFFDHTNPEGAGPMHRAKAAGFSSTFVGENIAAGQTDPARVVQAWIDSPGHCVNMMDPRYKVLGVGYFFDGKSDRFEHYWTQNFGG